MRFKILSSEKKADTQGEVSGGGEPSVPKRGPQPTTASGVGERRREYISMLVVLTSVQWDSGDFNVLYSFPNFPNAL